ncbi:unnamed protein product [Spirodela intermedia]|uniref:Uncharacterized protein n=1 Tax=Spirodela intermedia TaxID=51605 RepID=A0A7I8K4V5_SPIIN|nr:unnamed protein product [Spirodela intermedia]
MRSLFGKSSFEIRLAFCREGISAAWKVSNREPID